MDSIKLFAQIGAAAITLLSVLVVHYLPWQLMLGRPLPRILAYILGTLAIAVPTSMLGTMLQMAGADLLRWLWMLCLVGGLGTLSAHGLDSYLVHRARAVEGEQRERTMLRRVTK